MKKLIVILLLSRCAFAQPLAPLSVEKIMRDPRWIGVSPSNVYWAEDAKTVYFNWNPDKNLGDSLYSISLTDRTPKKVSPTERRVLPAPFGNYNFAFTKKIVEKNGDIFLHNLATHKTSPLTSTLDREYNASFSDDEKKVMFMANSNLFSIELATGAIKQHTDFKKGNKRTDAKQTEQDKWLKADQLATFDILKQRSDLKKASDKITKLDKPKRPKEIYLDEKNVDQVQLSPDGNYITYRLTKNPNSKTTIVPNYVTESGFTEDIQARTKVGAPQNSSDFFVYDILQDTVLQVKTNDIPGIFDEPDYKKDYPTKSGKKDKKPEPRAVNFSSPLWSADGKNNIMILRSADNKDRWIMTLDAATQKLKPLDRQRDEAWIGGPGTGGFFGNLNIGWLADNKTIWFQSEETGFSHLYLLDVVSGKKQALTSGKFEVQSVQLSRDKKLFYITTNAVHPGEKHFYKLTIADGRQERLTTPTGANEVSLSPDEKWLAIRYSYSNKPWELYLQENKVGAKPIQLTHSTTIEFNSYAWRDPELCLCPHL